MTHASKRPFSIDGPTYGINQGYVGTRLLGLDVSTGSIRGVMLPERGQPAVSDVVTVPAVVSFRGGKLAVGEPALMMAAVVPDTILPGPVRLLGRKADDPLVRRYAERFSLEVTLSKGELRWVPEDEPKDPGLGAVQAMTALFEHVLEMLDRARERHAVVAVPPWLSDAGRSQLVRAAAGAQITVRRFVTRPVAIALSLAADRQLLGRGMVVDAGSGGISCAVVEGRSRSLTVEQVASRDTAGADDVAAEIVRSVAPEGTPRQARELVRQGAEALMRSLEEASSAKRSVDTPDGTIEIRMEQWELDLLMGPAGHDLATVLEAAQSGKRRLPTWFAGALAGHRVLRSTASAKAQGPLRHVDPRAAALGAAHVAAMVAGISQDLKLDDGETLLAQTGRAARSSERGSAPPKPAAPVASGPEARRKQDTYRPPTNMTVKEVSTKRARTSTRRLSPEERAQRRRERSLQVREAQKGPLPTRGGQASASATSKEEPASAPDSSPPQPGSAPPAPSQPPPAPSEPPRPTPAPPAAPASAPPPKRASTVPPAKPAALEATPASVPPAEPPSEPVPESIPPTPASSSPEAAPAKPRVPTEPAQPRVQTQPPAPSDRSASRRLVTEPGIPVATGSATDTPAVTPMPSSPTVGRPVMSSRSSSGRRPTAPQISLGRSSDPGRAPSSEPSEPSHPAASSQPSMEGLSPPQGMSSAPPRVSELPPEKSSFRPADSSSPRPSAAPGGRLSLPPGAVWPEAGTLKNPRDAASILDMAIIRELREEDLEPVALPVLLRRVIGRADMTGTLTLEAGRVELALQVRDGCLLLARADHNALRRAFDEPAGTWRFVSGAAVDPRKFPLAELKKLRTLGLEGLRRMLRHSERDDLESTFGHRFDEAPAIHPLKTKHPRRLRLDRREVRAVEQHVDGKATVRELTHTTGLGANTTLQVLALLDMFEVLRWPEGDAL